MKTVVVRNIKRTDADLVKRLGVLGTATVHEAYGRTGLMKPYLRPVWAGGEAAGTAVTVLAHPGDNWMIHVAVEQCKPGVKYTYSAPPVFLFEPHQPEMCNFKPQVILNIDEVWDIKRKTFEILAAQKHLWAYYERVALQRGMQGGRNSGKAMTYGEAFQRLFPMAVEELA